MRKKWIIIIVILLLAGLLIGLRACFQKKAQTPGNAQDTNIHTVAVGDIDSRIEITGEIQPQTVVSQKSRVSGKVVKFYADENDYVNKGDIIADIEPDYNQANTLFNTKATLQRAELNLNQARKDFSDKTLLLERNYISQADFDAARDALLEAEIQFAQASSQYEMIRDLDVPGTVIHMYATASGTVIERKVNEGEMVTSSINAFGEGTVVMQIADLSKMVVTSNINEVDIIKFKVGQEAIIKLDALPYEEFSGKIISISPKAVVINSAKVFPVEISINATGDRVKPGMTAAISILGDSRKDVLIIPIGAVFADDKNQDIVYLIPKAKKQDDSPATVSEPVPTVIKLGANDFQMVEVISGLSEGDKISLTEPGSDNAMFFMN